MNKKQLKNKEFIDYIVNDQCKELISEFLKDINKVLSEGRPYNSIHELKWKWEEKLK